MSIRRDRRTTRLTLIDFSPFREAEDDLGVDHSAALVPISALPLLAQ